MPTLPPSVLADPLWAHLAANWKPIPKRPGYVFGLIVSALAIVLLPLLYLALMLAVISGAVWFTIWRVSSDGSRVARLDVMLTLLVWAVAIFILIFMLKPLFAPSEQEDKSVQLKQFEELQLHSFVENVCAILGAPAPKRIDITCEPNASAGFRGGLFGALLQNQPVLTIGLSLVAGMTRAQFAGVLAHEFGHFSQGAGMRVTYIAGSMASWVARAAFERDAWDVYLYAYSHAPDPWLRLVAWIARLGVLLSRLVIMPLALLGLAMCHFTSRQMEFDADYYEIQFAGSTSFERSTNRMGELNGAFPRAFEEAGDSFRRSSRLPDDFPAFAAAFADRLTPEQRNEIRLDRDKANRSLFNSHPSDPDRIAQACALDLPGLYRDESPAHGLFQNFEVACRKATRSEFRALLGPLAIEAKFVPVAAEIASSKQHAARAAILPRYLGFDPPTWRPLFPTISRIPDVEDAKPVAQRLRAARSELKDKARAAREQSECYRKVAEELLKWEHVRSVMDAKLRVDFKPIRLESTTRAGVSNRIEQLTNDSAAAADIIDDAGDMAMHRLSAALAMLGVAGIHRHIPESATLRVRADQLLLAAAVIRETLPVAALIRRLVGASDLAAAGIKNDQTFEAAKKLLRPHSDDIRNRLDDVRRLAGGTPDPFAPDDNNTNMGMALVGASPAWRDIEEIVSAGRLFVDRFADSYRRVLSELVEIGETIEKSIASQHARQPEADSARTKAQ